MEKSSSDAWRARFLGETRPSRSPMETQRRPLVAAKALLALARSILLLAIGLFAASILAFGLLEAFPKLVYSLPLHKVEYYAVLGEYSSDPTLVLVPRSPGQSVEATLVGDLYSPEYGVDVEPIPYRASYTDQGFRLNSAQPPFAIAVIGDSYIEIGEDDSDTLSERLGAVSGLGALNLGRAWYGPDQYLELLRRHVLPVPPRYALFCFFDGNDIEDVRQYRRWLREGMYYHYHDSILRTLVPRYSTAVADTTGFIIKSLTRRRRSEPLGSEPHPDVGIVQLRGQRIAMRFGYWNAPLSKSELLASGEWIQLRAIIAQFGRLCRANRIVPIVVFLPTKIQVYGSYVTDASGLRVRSQINRQRAVASNSLEAMREVAQHLNIPLIEVLPQFRRLAEEGRLLYYPFDTHWNRAGRQAAAEVIAEALTSMERNTRDLREDPTTTGAFP